MFEVGVADAQYVIKDKKILLEGVSLYPFSQTEIQTITGQTIYILFNDGDQKKLHLFQKKSGKWNSTNNVIPWYTQSGIFLEQQKPRVYTIINEPTPDKKRIKIQISIYEIDEAKIDLEKPATTITIPADKIFSSERCKTGEQLFPLPDKDGHYLLLGNCDQAKWDPIAIFGTIISGGHGGFANWPFLAEIKPGHEVSYYKWPVNYGTNAVAKVSQAILFGNKYHLVGTWHREYMPSRNRIEYSVFDFESDKWSKPEEVYKAARSQNVLFGSPAIQVNDENIFIAWSLRNDELLSPGIFVRCKSNNQWSDAIKLAPVMDSPLILDGRDRIPLVFWRENDKGIFLSSQEDGNWSVPVLVVSDEKIGTKNVPWDIKSDNDGTIHIVYFQENSNSAAPFDMNIVYACLEQER